MCPKMLNRVQTNQSFVVKIYLSDINTYVYQIFPSKRKSSVYQQFTHLKVDTFVKLVIRRIVAQVVAKKTLVDDEVTRATARKSALLFLLNYIFILQCLKFNVKIYPPSFMTLTFSVASGTNVMFGHATSLWFCVQTIS